MHKHTSHTHAATLPLKQRALNVFPALLAFLLPFGSSVLSWVIVVWMFVALLNWKSFSLQPATKNWLYWLMPAFFITTLISALSSATAAERGFAIEVKLSFILFPILFGGFGYPSDVIKRSAMAFVSGCFFAMLFLLARATYYTLQGESGYFYYTGFAGLMHASYFAMYLLFAIAIIMLYYPVWFKNESQILNFSHVYVAVLTLGIFLCASKLGLLSFFLLFPALLAYRLRGKFSLKKSILLFTSAIVLVIALLFYLPFTKERVYNLTHVSTHNIDKTSSESTTVRVLIWQQCIELIKEKPLLGYGVADANEVLYQRYEAEGLTGALEHHFNAHNQFFQTAIGAGLLGSLLLLGFTVFALVVALIRKQFLLVVLCILFTLNFLVESMLQTAAGVIFVAFMFNYLVVFFTTPLSQLTTKDEAI